LKWPIALKFSFVPGTVVHTCNPSYSGGGDRRMMVQGQVNQAKVNEIISKNKPGVLGHAYNLSYSGGSGSRIMI
jgi:hypothetical protein